MALSPSDKEFYEQRLELSSYKWVVGATVLIGALAWPLLRYMQDSSSGLADKWTMEIVLQFSMIGLCLGLTTSVLMYLAFKFLLEMGWLPSRR